MIYIPHHNMGYDLTKDEEFARLKNDAVAGDAKAQYVLAGCYNRGDRVSEDQAEARRLFLLSAEQGFAPAEHAVGFLCMKGEFEGADESEGLKWFERAVEHGNPRDIWLLIESYERNGFRGADPAKITEWLKKKAEADEDGCYDLRFGRGGCDLRLGHYYEKGICVAKDEAEAFKWYRRAAEKCPEGQFELGYCYEKGIGTAPDRAEAVKWYARAAEEGDPIPRRRMEALRREAAEPERT